ncbi:hypothetical protein [Streptomyces sp. NPDC006477]|uniref:hypothetical protein n=1 Tax=Streptomyces sp. NPDC006477 TaxID=3364747 RepID=UPI00368C7090
MTTAPRPRFSVRAGLAEAPEHDGPFDDVPEHLLGTLQQWVTDTLQLTPVDFKEAEARAACLRLRIPVASSGYKGKNYVKALSATSSTQLLDVVDELLLSGATEARDIEMLICILDDAGSAYRVNEEWDGLEEKVIPAVRDAVRHAIAEAATASSAGSAADHLATAWQAAYGRNPDPERAYSESIKAVESAAHAVIQPNNAKATLGTMLGEIRNARHKFDAAIPPKNGDPIAPAEAMMQALWDGQTSRHGAQTRTRPETLESARAGVHLAAALVQWFVSGAVIRTP